jgi:hypothetical protein
MKTCAKLLSLVVCCLVAACANPSDQGGGGGGGPPGPLWPGSASVVSAGGVNTCALSGGAAWCWGNPQNPALPIQLGVTGDEWVSRCGDGYTVLPSYEWPCVVASPVRIGGAALTSLNIWNEYSPPCGMDASGTAWCWDDRRYLELPAGAVPRSGGYSPPRYLCGGISCAYSASRVRASAPFKAYVNSGALACAVTVAGALQCMGTNGYGELGNPAFPAGSIDSLVAVAPSLTFTDVAIGRLFGDFACALATAGTVHCWGQNDFGQLGTGSQDQKNVPTQVLTALKFSQIVAGSRHVCALTLAGQAYCWGWNPDGDLGNGLTGFSLTPGAVSGSHTFTSLTAGSVHTCGLDTAGAAWCWGGDALGELGVDWSTSCPGPSGVVHCSLTPVAVRGGLTFKQLSAGVTHTCGVTTSNDVYCWGSANYGELGTGYAAGRIGSAVLHPVKVVAR